MYTPGGGITKISVWFTLIIGLLGGVVPPTPAAFNLANFQQFPRKWRFRKNSQTSRPTILLQVQGGLYRSYIGF